MWIRSQDKKQLVNANDLYIATRGKGYCISTGKGNDLASYLSEEKAIKVLDMIHETLLSDLETYLDVFQMPHDDEVEV